MKTVFDYEGMLIHQCNLLKSALEGKRAADSSMKIFAEICRQLTKDFLPPIEREDIAGLSYLLLEIQTKCEALSRNGAAQDKNIKKQLDLIPDIIKGLLKKKKTCGEDIRRFVIINMDCRKNASAASAQINDALADFIKAAHSAFFKNL